SGGMRTASTLRKGAGWRSFKDEAWAACQRRVEVVAGASLKRRADHARRAGCCGGGCLPEMGPPGIVNATSTARLEDLSVGGSRRGSVGAHQGVRAALDVAGDRALGVLWGTGPAASRADVFLSLTEAASAEDLPLNAWVRFQMVLIEGSSDRGLYTSGLTEFVLMEIEMPPCST
ncbi:MAG: hypothetical protein ACJAZN_003988, partial [Planctomycetota bacterium]